MGRQRWFASVRYRVWGRTFSAVTAGAAVLALAAPMAVAQGVGVGPYRFTGTLWNPQSPAQVPGVGGHALSASHANTPQAKGTKPLKTYQAAAPSWPQAGTSTVALVRAAAASKPSSAGQASPSPSATGQSTAPVTGPVKASGLPVWVAPQALRGRATTAAPAKVKVQVASHAQTLAAGGDGLLVGLTRADGQKSSGQVQVVLDYSKLAKAYGGGFGSRLRLFRVPACALTTPQLAACRTRTPVASSNRAGAGQLTATVDLAASTVSAPTTATGVQSRALLATATAQTALLATSGSSGSQGNYSATSLQPSGTWQASASGSYEYSYPLSVPAAPGGDTPPVTFSYDSQSVDGETSARNSQSSWLGDGWSYTPGFVEQSYRSCGSLLDANQNPILKGSADECWAGDNATLSFGAHSGVLVPTATDPNAPGELKAWKLQGDDGTVVQELSGAANGLQDGTYYRVLLTDGSAAYFGSDHAPAGVGSQAVPQSGTPTDASTDSAWGVPVLHPVSGDPCYTAAQGTASKCAKPQGWRWNLDFTVSPTGFVQRYDYKTEPGYYDLGGGQAPTGTSGTLSAYTRAGALSVISYGYKLSDELAGRTPGAQVTFASKQRCQTSSTFTDCSAGNLNDSTAPNWPDVPYDIHCDSGDSTTVPAGATTVPANVCVTSGPTFWSTTRLDSVTTAVHVIDPVSKVDQGLQPVDSYQLGQVFSDAGGTVDPVTGTTVDRADAGSLQAVMWLQSIKHTGLGTYGNGNSPITLNQVSFTGTEIDNRVNDVSPSAPPLYHPRISSIQTETGASIAVNYNLNPCKGLTLSFANADSNTNSCYPVYWSPAGQSQPVQDWFNKITVHSVVTADLTLASQYTPDSTKITAGSSAHVATYYYNGPAWHRDDSAQTDDQYRTWDQFRGYRTVTMTTGAAPDPVTQQITTYLQGMDGDYKADGSQRSVSVSDSVGDQVTDSDWLAGSALETDSYTQANGSIVSKSISDVPTLTTTAHTAQTAWTDWTLAANPGKSAPALSTLPDLTARRVTSASSRDYALLADGTTWRETKQITAYDGQGRVHTQDALGDVSVPSQESCTTTSYAAPSAMNAMMLAYPDQVTTVSGPCATPSSGTLLSDKQMYYDGDGTLTNLGTFGQLDQGTVAAPALGQVTATRVATSITGSTEQWQTTAAMSYDDGGRPVQVLDAAGRLTKSSFTPAWSDAGNNTNATQVVSTNPNGWSTTSTLDPQRSLVTESVDANGRITDSTYDALGRRTAVWLPGRSKSAGQSADQTFAYAVNPGAVPAPGGTITHGGAPSTVTTNTLRDDGTYSTAISIYDGMLQTRQTQTSSAGDQNSGRLIADSFYDSHGWPSVSYATYSDPNNAPSSTIWAANENEIPSEQITQYDGLGRPVTSQLYHQAIEQWQSTTSYPGADETDTTSPAGGSTTASFTNALGQTTATTVKDTAAQAVLSGGQVIPSGTSLTSDSVRLAMGADGNLVLSSLASGATLWSSNTSGNPGAWATYQTDGNFVIYDLGRTKALWSSGTYQTGAGGTLKLQNDANLALYSSTGTTAWQSSTAGKASEADSTTRYTYTAAGQVATVKDTAGNTWSYNYNLLGQKTSQTDPNTGTSTFDKYDVLGNLLQSTDSRGQSTSSVYDWDNRVVATYAAPWSATPDPATELTSTLYDTLAKGYATSTSSYVGGSGTGGKTYTQGVIGYTTAYQPTGTTLSIPSADGFTQPKLPTGLTAASGQTLFATTSTYTDTNGLLATTQFQNDGGLPVEQISYGYNQQGGLNGFGGSISPTNVPSYVDNTVHDAFGRVLQTNYGPSGKELATYAQYDETTGRVTQTKSMLQPSTTALDVTTYRYNQVGEITAVDDLQNNTTHDTQCFTYDSLKRLTQAWTDTAGITNPTVTPVGAVGGCTTAAPTTTVTAPVTTTTVGGPAPYWQSYTYDLLGDRTGMVNHDTTGNAANNTTQTTGYTGADATKTAALPNQAGPTTTSNPGAGSATSTPGYTDSQGKNAGNTLTRTASSTGPLSTAFTLSGGGKLCVETAGGAVTAGTKAQINTCTGAAAQTWSIAADSTVRVQGMCLGTAGGATASGTAVVINTCNSATATQKWTATTAGTLVNGGSTALCLTDPAASATKPTALTITACTSTGTTWTTPATGHGTTAAGQTQTLTYDAAGRTASVTTGTTTSRYTYDASGKLLEQATGTGPTSTTDTSRVLYLFGGAEQLTLAVPNKATTALRNYTGPDGTTITRTSAGAVTYQIANAQGTAETAVNASTLTVTRRYYDPYGNPRGTSPSPWISADENHGFLGQPADATSGLNLLGARNYDPVQGRFLTPDPIFESGDPSQMGGYTYAADNPASGSDPSGLAMASSDGGGGGGGSSGSSQPPICDYTTTGCGGSGTGGTTPCHVPMNCGSGGGGDNSTTTTTNSNGSTTVTTKHTTTQTTTTQQKSCSGIWGWISCHWEAVLTVVVVVVVVVITVVAAVTCMAATGATLGAAAMICAPALGAVAGAVCSAVMGDCGPGGGEDPAATHDTSGDHATKAVSGDSVSVTPHLEDETATTTASSASPDNVATGSHGSTGKGCSFAPDTPVLMADGTTKAIGSIQPGDNVESADPTTGKNQGARPVTATWINHDHDLIDLTVTTGPNGQTATLHTTAEHPFWNPDTHTWTPAGQLKPGQTLATDTSKTVTVKTVTPTAGTADRDNLTVLQLHTYYVMAGSTPILVHNVCPTSAALGAAPHPVNVNFHPSVDLTKKTVAKAGSIQAASGYASDVPDGYSRALPAKVLAAFPTERTPHPFMDNSAGPGAYYLSHAERQASVLNPGYSISVSRDMCNDCISWFQGRAQQLGVTIFTSDPTAIHVFSPDGSWDSYDYPEWMK
ncbi:RHS repeat-associated protein [Streptomyces sp. 846.5]|nr:polymorphic toxin-type HINT domain-containing protein [Streptomyces sp. 846.5]TDU04192.1 RHS repeat-associated protein [Streptomyces sp. 846.5]